MNQELFEATKIAAYTIWERTKCQNALALWYCSEDIANYLERSGILSDDGIKAILQKDKYDRAYIEFMQHIAYRLYIYTNREDELENWFDAEKLSQNDEWLAASLNMAQMFSENKENVKNLGIKCEAVRDYYLK